jgi:lipopolysaccharide/colanic/teichoic acid biosynthesis glycosyltransferase
LLDIIIALFFLILLSPIFLILGIITKLIYPKQRIFTSQNRVDGRSGREFKMWRFATLPKGAKEKVPTKLNYKDFSKQKDIKSLGRFAKFMRRSHLMDLPQFYNVLRGDMGIVGPRPPFLVEYENYDWFDRKRLLIKPGITGMWQINKTQDTFDEMVRLDKFYVENWSFWLDLKIVLISIFKFFFGRLDSR